MAEISLLVGTQKGAFILSSDKKREKWDVKGPLMKGWTVFDLVHDARTTPRLYAGVGSYVYGPTVHTSDDFGETWQQVEHSPQYSEDSGFKLNNVWTVVPGRESEPETLYAGVDEAGLFVSRDRGMHWEEVSGLTSHPSRKEWFPGAGGLCCHSICLDPDNENRMWVGISAVGVFRTDDGGKTWEASNDGLNIIAEGEVNKEIGTCVHRMLVDPKNPERLFQQNHQGVFRSLNGGKKWERIENGVPSQFGFPMVMLPNDSNTLFIFPQEKDEFRMAEGGKPAVYRTTNGGDSWEALRNGLPEDAFVSVLRQAMAVDGCDEPGVYVGTTSGQIFYSRDAGDHWQEMPVVVPRIQSLNVVMGNGQ